jgi:DNA-directed RNA polymerase subunit RPC12/RpoP
MERICVRCGVHVVIPKNENVRKCPRCKGLLIEGTMKVKKMN